MKQISFELGAIASHCLEVYKVIKESCKDIPIVLEFPALEKNLFDKIEKSAMYVYTEMM